MTLPRRKSSPQPEGLPQRAAAVPIPKAARSQPQAALAQAASAGTEEEVSPQLQARGALMAALRPRGALAQAAPAGTEQVVVSSRLQARGAVMAAPRPLRAVTQAAEQTGTPQLP
jgi:hypothetical protein